MGKQVWLGIDVAKETFHAAVAASDDIPREWKKLPHADFVHSPKGINLLKQWLEQLGVEIIGVCLEATGQYSHRWMELAANDFVHASMINPAFGVEYGRSIGIRSKNDRIDACVLALYGQNHKPVPKSQRSPEQQILRELSRGMAALQAQFQANKQRLLEVPCKKVRAALMRVQKCLQNQINRLRKAMEEQIASMPILTQDVRRITTVKGIGTTTAVLIVAEFGDLRTYNRDEIIALAGLFAREHTSGKSVHKKARLVKTSKKQLRSALYMCAMSASRSNPHIRAFARRLTKNRKAPMQILGAIMRKLLLIAHAVVVTGRDYDPGYGMPIITTA